MKLTYSLNDRVYEFDLQAQPTGSIGRSRSNTLKIRDHNISRTHVKFDLKGEVLLIADQDSRNGFVVNGLRVSEAELKPGDEFCLGALKIRFEAGAPSPGSAAMPATSDDDPDDEPTISPRPAPQIDQDAATTLDQPLPGRESPRPKPPTPPPATAAPATVAPAVAQPPAMPISDGARVPVLIIRQDGVNREYPVRFQRVSIGVQSDNDLVLDAGKVSRYHAEIRQVDQVWILRDLGSKNGTLVNGQKIEEAVLNDGDRLEVGTAQITFKWAAQSGAAAKRSNPVRIGVIGASSLVALVGIALVAAPFVVKNPRTSAPSGLNAPALASARQFEEFMTAGTARLKEALGDGKFDGAKRNFEQAARLQTESSAFLDLAGFLEKHQSDRTATPWEELAGLVERCRKIPELPADCRGVLTDLAGEADFESKNGRAYGDILVLLDGKEWEKALAAIRRVPERSLYHRKVAPQIPDVRAKMKAQYVAQVDRMIKDRELHKALDLIAKAQDASDILDQDLYHKKLLCQRNIEDSKRLEDAKVLVAASGISEARTLIGQIDPKSFCFEDGQSLLQEVERKQLLKDVAQLYRDGQGEDALVRLQQAKPKTSEMVELAKRIDAVLKLFQEGSQAREEKNFAASRSAGKALTSLEPDENNFYNQAGLELQSETPYELANRSLKVARERLAANDFPGARARFEEALGHQPGNKEAADGLKKLAESASREYNRVINDKNIGTDKVLARLKEIRQWVTNEDRLARSIDAKVREIESK